MFLGRDLSIMWLLLVFYYGMYVYVGWFYFNFVIEEVENFEKIIFFVICIFMVIVIIGYVLINVVYFMIINVEELLFLNVVVVIFFEWLLGNFLLVVLIFVVFFCFGFMNGGVFVVFRLFYVVF